MAVELAVPTVLKFDYEADEKTKKVMCYNADGELTKGQVACNAANKAIHDNKLGKTSPALMTKEDAEKTPGCYKGNVAVDA